MSTTLDDYSVIYLTGFAEPDDDDDDDTDEDMRHDLEREKRVYGDEDRGA